MVASTWGTILSALSQLFGSLGTILGLIKSRSGVLFKTITEVYTNRPTEDIEAQLIFAALLDKKLLNKEHYDALTQIASSRKLGTQSKIGTDLKSSYDNGYEKAQQEIFDVLIRDFMTLKRPSTSDVVLSIGKFLGPQKLAELIAALERESS